MGARENDYPIRPVPFTQVHLTDSFWAKRIETNRLVTIPFVFVKGFARIHRTWKTGDVIELDLPMPIREVEAHEKVKDNHGKTALERGPLVYCAEWLDNGGQVSHIVIEDEDVLEFEFKKGLLGGVGVITDRKKTYMAIPYYAWSHRGVGEMAVWLPRASRERGQR